MIIGPVPPRHLPKQDPEKVQRIAEWWLRAQTGMTHWSKTAKECVDFVEGRQWTTEQLQQLKDEGRPALVFNKIAPLVRLIIGYQRNNRTDTRFYPGDDGQSNQAVAEVLSLMFKQYSMNSKLPAVDGEVWRDGLTTGRGWWRTKLDFRENDFGELKTAAEDPFAVYPDPDGDDYDINQGGSRIQISRWVSIDEIEYTWGRQAAQLVTDLTRGDGYTMFPSTFYETGDETTPVRRFGGQEDNLSDFWNALNGRWVDFVDPHRKNIRLIETEYKVTEMMPCFIDLETGDREPVPTDWKPERIQKVLYYAEQKNNPLVIRRRPVQRIRWTTMIGDLIVFDDWSPYKEFTVTGFFPYFRRGETRGMVHDLLDPQREINKRRSAEIDIVTRTTNSGWLHHENALDPEQEEYLDNMGAAPGIRVKWKGDPGMKPEKINPSPPPTSMERLEQKAQEDLKHISGINDTMLGQIDRVQSGRALEARTKQGVLSIQEYMDNFKRSKELLARKFLSGVQRHYTEERMIRVMGERGKMEEALINKLQLAEDGMTVIGKLNDITLGKYGVAIDETPFSASYQAAQFEEALDMLEKIGPLVPQMVPLVADLVVEMSSMPHKDEWRKRIQAALGIQDPGAAGAGGAPGAAPGQLALPAPQPPGSNVIPMPAAGGA